MSSHYFIGIPIDESLRYKFEEWQDELRKQMNYKVWTHPEDFHITLKFLGACQKEQIEEWIFKLKSESWPSPFSLQLGPASFFGNEKHPRVFHVDIKTSNSLTTMKRIVERNGTELGFPTENREYSPHVTLAKKWVNGFSPFHTGETTLEETFQMIVDRFYICKIHPGQRKKYEEIAQVSLKRENDDGSIN
ncbi:RNA 2',3'-cyclic phosphodiesterase [Halobacillus seohaensis]|uniref:RNA 2',3'-cyclic phosphodiesterase n=1 Tax=Halobacillus seohaensis TaxID=447421 RepID=A0ABW2ELR7_9BACI